jgi:hypothetical protein
LNFQEYKERLNILVEQEVIVRKSYDVALIAFYELLKKLKKKEVDHAEMLFTHLPMALTRINNGEDVEGPSEEVVKEIKGSEHFELSEGQVNLIEKNWGDSLPKGERDYLHLHYSIVLKENI